MAAAYRDTSVHNLVDTNMKYEVYFLKVNLI